MKIGIIELQAYAVNTPWERVENFFSYRQTASLTPQAISVWCRQMGHETYYTTYYGFGNPEEKFPKDLDFLFLAAPTYLAPFAYALSKICRQNGAKTVIGGAHANSFPNDCLRYFDYVVHQCDKALIADLLANQFEPGNILSSQHPFAEPPTIEERLPEIRKSAFVAGRPYPGTFIPMLASTGCPYSCDFCIDWNNPFHSFSDERLLEDLKFASENFPKVMLGFHDPNFAIRFDDYLGLIEQIPPDRRNPYGIQSTLTLLNPERLQRLKNTNCRFLLPSVEAWTTDYGNKVGVGKIAHNEKLNQVVELFNSFKGYIPYLGTNFIFGLDNDEGDLSFDLTKEFIRQTPFVWSTLHIPMPFGGTPLQARWRQENRILKSMPFMFYKIPYLTITLKNYHPADYFQKMADLFDFATSNQMLMKRFSDSDGLWIAASHYFRTITDRRRVHSYRQTAERLKSDPAYLAFHLGERDDLPDFYAHIYSKRMGKYAELIPIEESSRPILGGTVA